MTIKKRSTAFLIIGVLAILLPGIGTVQAAEYGSIGGRPTQADPKVSNSASWFIYNLSAGQLKEDAVEIQNNGAETQELIVYAADSTPSSDGGFALKQQVETMTGVGNWITFYPDALPAKVVLGSGGIIELCRLQPPPSPAPNLPKLSDELQRWCQGKKTVDVRLDSLSKTRIPFVIHIPDQVDVGEHAGAIIIQKKTTERKEGEGSAINLTTRVGVRVYETVPGDIVRKLSISRFTVTRSTTQPKYVLLLGVQNTGNVSLENSSTIQVADTFLKRRDEKIERTMQALPGQELVINTDWPRPIFGRYRFIASASYKDGDQTRHLDTAPIVIWIVPWREVAIGLAIILLGLLGWLGWWIRNQRRYKCYAWVKVTIKAGETVASLAESAGVSWKKIAQKNKLKAPYHLTPGQSLQLFLSPPAAKRSGVQSQKLPKNRDRSSDLPLRH
jgi:hypothetical protein